VETLFALASIAQNIYNEMIAHAVAETPNECCGLLAGEASHGLITKIYRMSNLPSDDPRIAGLDIPSDRRFRYMMDPQEQFLAMKEMRSQGMTMIGIYHSHPHSPAYPSATDVRLAFYADLFYFIVSLENQRTTLRAFRIVDQMIQEEEIKVLMSCPTD